MPGTKAGSAKTRARNLEKTTIAIDCEIIQIEKGTYYKHLGYSGGIVGGEKGFSLMSKAKHRAASSKGGKQSRRGKTQDEQLRS